MNERDYWTIEAMHRFGWSFVKALAQLASHADPNNLRSIKNTWHEYWLEYEDMGRKLEKEDLLK